MSKIITQLVSIAKEILDTNPNFTQIDTKLNQIEKELNKNFDKN